MEILTTITGRKSCRAFTLQKVEKATLESILDAARWAPSGVNSQPWQVCVVQGETKTLLSERILQARKNGQPPNPDYMYYPQTWEEPYKTRRKVTGLAMYQALGIGLKDVEQRLTAWNRNYRFFDAPVGIMILIDKNMAQGSWLDLGMFMQNIFLAARAYNLETCPQASMAEFPDIVRDTLSLEARTLVACGIAIGYPDKTHPVNNFQLTREPVDSFTRWYE